MNTVTQHIARVSADIETNGRATEFLRLALARALAPTPGDTGNYFAARWPRSKSLDILRKAPVAVGSTGGWGAPVSELAPFSAALIEVLRPLTVLGRLQGMRRVPFNVRVPRVTAGGSAVWVGQGNAKPLSALSLDSVELSHAKVCGLVVFTKELAQLSDPTAEAIVRSDMIATIAAFTDQQFLDPSVAEVADTSPASITNGATEIPATADIEADFKSLFAAVTSNLANPYLIMTRRTAIDLATQRTASGDRLFPAVNAMGGDIWGVPVLTSASAPADSDSPSNAIIVLLDAAEIMIAEGDVETRVLQHVSLQMDDAPDSPPTATTTMVSLWQLNLIGLGFTRYVRWMPRRTGAVAYISGFEA
jgi:HK97 family phage major capsid protein